MKNGLFVAMNVLSLSAFAFLPDFQKLQSSHEKKAQAKYQTEKASGKVASPTCANFSGKWKGACEDSNGQKTQSEFEIKQGGCQSLEVFNKDSQGTVNRTAVDLTTGMETKTTNSSWGGLSYQMGARWNADQQVLLAETSGLFSGRGIPLQNFRNSVQMMLDKEELVQFSSTMGDSQGDRTSTCRYQKQP